jgi:hypothetical protein
VRTAKGCAGSAVPGHDPQPALVTAAPSCRPSALGRRVDHCRERTQIIRLRVQVHRVALAAVTRPASRCRAGRDRGGGDSHPGPAAGGLRPLDPRPVPGAGGGAVRAGGDGTRRCARLWIVRRKPAAALVDKPPVMPRRQGRKSRSQWPSPLQARACGRCHDDVRNARYSRPVSEWEEP